MLRKSNDIFIKSYFRFYFISTILSIITILSLISIEFNNFALKIISLSLSFFIIGISIGSYALISIRNLCLTNSNSADRMNHIGLFIPIILVIAFLIKVIINLIFLLIKDWLKLENFYFYLFMAFIYLFFNLLGYFFQEENELRKVEFPNVLPCIRESLKRIRILSFILLFLICKIEKLLWEIIFAVNAYEYYDDTKGGIDTLKLHDFSSFIIFIPPIIFGYIHDKYEFLGFKRILYFGCFINILTCSYSCYLMYNEKNIIHDNIIFILSIINEIFRSGNYAMFLPEIIKKFEIQNLLIISGLVSSSFLIIQPLEIFLTDYFQKYSKELLFKEISILLIFQILSSFIIIILLCLKGVNDNLGMGKQKKISFVASKDIKFQIENEEFEDEDYIEDQNSIDNNNEVNIKNNNNIDESNPKNKKKENNNKEQIENNYQLFN